MATKEEKRLNLLKKKHKKFHELADMDKLKTVYMFSTPDDIDFIPLNKTKIEDEHEAR